MAIILMVLSIVIHQLEGIFIKKYNSKHNSGEFIFTAIVSFFSMIFFVITDRNGLNFLPQTIVYGIIAGIAYCIASFTTYIALSCGSYILTGLIRSYGILITIIQGFMREEPITVLKLMGISIVIASLYFFKSNDEEAQVKITKKWIINITLSVAAAGAYGILQRQQQIVFNNNSTNEFMIVSLGISALILFSGALIKEGKELKYVLKHGCLYAIGGGLSNGATNMLNLIIYAIVPLSYSAPVKTGLTIMYSFVISRFVFKEVFTKKQIFGVVLGMTALVLLNIKC